MATRRNHPRNHGADPDEIVGEVTAGIVRLQRRKRRVKRLKRAAIVTLVLAVAAGVAYWIYDDWERISWRQLMSYGRWPFRPK